MKIRLILKFILHFSSNMTHLFYLNNKIKSLCNQRVIILLYRYLIGTLQLFVYLHKIEK